jgi:hypothetical protein
LGTLFYIFGILNVILHSSDPIVQSAVPDSVVFLLLLCQAEPGTSSQ